MYLFVCFNLQRCVTVLWLIHLLITIGNRDARGAASRRRGQAGAGAGPAPRARAVSLIIDISYWFVCYPYIKIPRNRCSIISFKCMFRDGPVGAHLRDGLLRRGLQRR